jgi:spermidine synthase
LLSAIPSALLVSVTNYLTTDIAAVPLLWVLPLALYLLSFVLAFSRWRIVPRRVLAALLPILVLILLLAMLIHATEPIWLLLPGHLVTMFVAAWVCHGELAERRPPAERLTHFYLMISLGGALGGLASALAAPMIFRAPQTEYALALIAACALAPSVRRTLPPWNLRDLWRPVKLGLGTAIVVWIVNLVWPDPGRWLTGGIFGLPLIGAALLMDRPRHFAAALAAIFGASLLFHGPNGPALVTERNFFGVVRVTREPSTGWHRLVHGNTVHGRQAWFDGEPEPTPLTYYYPTGPAGQLFRAIGGRFKTVANCGLGTGALAYYAKRKQEWTFYEIDPAVVHVAQDPNLFTFLRDSAAAPCPIVLGDARLQLRHAPDGGFDVIIIDCFSSDAIPVHLLTREALALYLQKLAPGGLIVFHISNRYLDLRPVLATLAADAKLDVCRIREDTSLEDDERAAGKMPSVWAILARKADDLGPLKLNARWVPADTPIGFRVWTDDYSHLWGVFKWQ